MLILDDSPDDAEQASAALRQAGYMLKTQRLETGVAVEQNLQVRLSRGTAEPYDGVRKISWPNAAGLDERLGDPKIAAALEAFRKRQEHFIDLDCSRFFFAAEEDLLGGEA